LETDIHSESYDSIGGIMIEQLDRLPEDGESVLLEDGTKLTVRGLDQSRIEKIEIELPEPAVNEEDGEGEEEIQKEENYE
ncbi:MAG: hemolysin, partial [Lachnospiraceae bacterium]|nr:hemolysin [Lachnospiraceae bacterium]